MTPQEPRQANCHETHQIPPSLRARAPARARARLYLKRMTPLEPLLLPKRRANSMTIHPLPPASRRADRIALLQQNVERVIRGKAEVVQLCIAALLANG